MTPQEKMQDLLRARRQIERDIFAHLREHCSVNNHLGMKSIADYYNWKCPTSPVGICLYNDLDDPPHDTCIYCGGPEERK